MRPEARVARSPEAESSLLRRIRSRCAEVARRAEQVRIHPPAVETLARDLVRVQKVRAQEDGARDDSDPAHQRLDSAEASLAFVLCLDAINFGSGWFPVLRKRPGRSGYGTVAEALRERFRSHGPWSARELAELGPRDLGQVLGQPAESPAEPLMRLYARALSDLGAFLQEQHAGRFLGPVEQARGSAARLVELLAAMPLYRDVARYAELEVPFYKRGQITASDLAFAFAGEGPGCFHDLDELTLFADNLVPHVLRLAGVLRYAPELAERIDREELLVPGSAEEVEIRAVALHAVEQLVAACARLGVATSARELDLQLWQRGQAPAIKAIPRHRCRCSFY